MTTTTRLMVAKSEVTKHELEAKAATTLGLPDLTLNATEVLGRKKFDINNLPIIHLIASPPAGAPKEKRNGPVDCQRIIGRAGFTSGL
jgi:hypothetical protein